MLDSHTHLHLCKQPEAELIDAALAAGVTRIATVGIDRAGNRAALAAAERFACVYAVVGVHPNASSGFDDGALRDITELAAHPKCVAIGETGLDYFRDGAPREDQLRAFHAQIELARDTGKALVIHTRAAEDDTIRTLQERAGDLRVIIHCFSMPDRIDDCLANENWWISFAGNVTYPQAHGLRTAAALVPADRLLVETDAPFLAPQVVRGKPNQPANVVATAQLIAHERRVPYDELERAVQIAGAAVYGW